jgi:hypothetical protein
MAQKRRSVVATTTGPADAIDQGNTRLNSTRRARLQRDMVRLHRLRPRAIFERLAALDRDHDIRGEDEALVNRYATRLDAHMLAMAGGDRFAPALWVVP